MGHLLSGPIGSVQAITLGPKPWKGAHDDSISDCAAANAIVPKLRLQSLPYTTGLSMPGHAAHIMHKSRF